jgi:hypothetical protein
VVHRSPRTAHPHFHRFAMPSCFIRLAAPASGVATHDAWVVPPFIASCVAARRARATLAAPRAAFAE